jgi:hypothetical protein
VARAVISVLFIAVSVAWACCVAAYGQPGTAHQPRIEIVDAPQYDCGGPETTGAIVGKVAAENPEKYGVILYSYACNGIAYIQPTIASPRTRISSSGDFRAEIHLGTASFALLVRADAKNEFKPQVIGAPTKGGDILAVATVPGKQVH